MKPMTLEEFATIRAQLDAGESLDQTLSKFGLTVERWDAQQRSVVNHLAADASQGKLQAISTYRSAYANASAAAAGPRPHASTLAPAAPTTSAPPKPSVTSTSPPRAVPAPVASAAPTPSRARASFQLTVPPGGRGGPPIPMTPPASHPIVAPVPRAYAPSSAIPSSAIQYPPPLAEIRVEVAVQDDSVTKMTAPPRSNAGSGPAMPFGKGTVALPSTVAEAPTLMPLEQYAEITARLRRENNPMKTFEQLGIKPDRWMEMVRGWSTRFAADPSLERQFEALIQRSAR